MYKYLMCFVILILANITAQAMYDEEDIQEHWRNKIGYKDHNKYMKELGGTEEQKEYSRERNFVISAENGNLEECESFLDSGGNINANNNRGTALGVAARNNHINVCRLLISRGADIDLFNEGETPLMLATECGRIEICELLIQHGANVNVRRPGTGQTLRYYAKNNLEIISLLEKHGLTKLERQKDKEEVTPVDQESNQQKHFDSGISSWCNIL